MEEAGHPITRLIRGYILLEGPEALLGPSGGGQELEARWLEARGWRLGGADRRVSL